MNFILKKEEVKIINAIQKVFKPQSMIVTYEDHLIDSEYSRPPALKKICLKNIDKSSGKDLVFDFDINIHLGVQRYCRLFVIDGDEQVKMHMNYRLLPNENELNISFQKWLELINKHKSTILNRLYNIPSLLPMGDSFLYLFYYYEQYTDKIFKMTQDEFRLLIDVIKKKNQLEQDNIMEKIMQDKNFEYRDSKTLDKEE